MLRILLEGPDGAGKSFLAKQLKGSLNAHVIHNDKPPLGPTFWFNVEQMLHACAEKMKRPRPTVIDRAWPSDIVYAPTRNRSPLDEVCRRMFERVQLGLSIRTVMCLPSPDSAKQNWKGREGEMITDDKEWQDVYDGYCMLTREWMVDHRFPVTVYDYTWFIDKPDAYVASYIIDSIERTPQYVNFGPGIGNLRPGNILIMGEQVNNSAHDLPFVHPHASSVFITQTLIDAGVQESELYWVNAKSLDGAVLPDGEWYEFLSPSRVIALSSEASIWLSQRGKKGYSRIPHPAFWRRFKVGKPYSPLLEALK